ncbi:MAG: hypothetical protein ACRDGE_07440 [Candidatus Limnocylindria bacterium]
MLRISSDAADVLRQTREQAAIPDTYGLRIFAERATDSGADIALGFAPAPDEGDLVSEQEGLTIFVASEVAEPLSEAVLDARQADDGKTLVLRPAREG